MANLFCRPVAGLKRWKRLFAAVKVETGSHNKLQIYERGRSAVSQVDGRSIFRCFYLLCMPSKQITIFVRFITLCLIKNQETL